MTLCAIWFHLLNLKSVKKTHGGVFFLVYTELQRISADFDCSVKPRDWEASHFDHGLLPFSIFRPIKQITNEESRIERITIQWLIFWMKHLLVMIIIITFIQYMKQVKNYKSHKNGLFKSGKPNLVTESGVHSSFHLHCHDQRVVIKFNLKTYYQLPSERNVWHFKTANSDNIRWAIANFSWERAFEN